MKPAKKIKHRLDRLQEHLQRENPLLVEVVGEYRNLDRLGVRLGLLKPGESYATQIAWWPLVSILGTFSAGKSSFINTYLGIDNLQNTGNQAVDDRFTVVTFTADGEMRTLPGLALDGDPRFPFYQISEEIEEVSEGEGAKIDNYLQLKVAPSEKLRGKILIDSPGFDADEQRKETLRITDHIIDLSDLVLVFFDARHPEPGAMQDTLEHLVKGAQRRNDSSKFIFVLNQIDTTAKEDNLEEVVSSWQKALVQNGLASGQFCVLYNKRIAVPIDDEVVRQRYEAKRDKDYERIDTRMKGLSTERIYRIVGAMESLANQIEQQAVPRIQMAKQRWKKRVLWTELLVFLAVVAVFGGLTSWLGYWQGFLFNPPWLPVTAFNDLPNWGLGLIAGFVAAGLFGLHAYIREKQAARVARDLETEESYGNLAQAFLKNTPIWRSIYSKTPAGWGMSRGVKIVDQIRHAADSFVQKLNDGFSDPSGQTNKTEEKSAPDDTQTSSVESKVNEQTETKTAS